MTRIKTLAVHAGYCADRTTRAAAVPIQQTVAYAFDNAQHGANLFDLKVAGNIYARITIVAPKIYGDLLLAH